MDERKIRDVQGQGLLFAVDGAEPGVEPKGTYLGQIRSEEGQGVVNETKSEMPSDSGRRNRTTKMNYGRFGELLAIYPGLDYQNIETGIPTKRRILIECNLTRLTIGKDKITGKMRKTSTESAKDSRIGKVFEKEYRSYQRRLQQQA